MPISLRRLYPALLVTLAACGPFGSDAPDEVDTDSTATAEQAAVEGDSETPPETLPESAEDPEGGAVGEPSPDQTITVQADTLATLAARLDSILAGQEAINRRLDSLAGTPAAADTTGALRGSSELLGEASRSVQSFTLAALMSVVLIIIFYIALRGIVWVLDALAEQNARRRLFYKRLVPIIRIVHWMLAAYLIVAIIFRVDAQGIFAAAAAIGVAVGFASQDLLKNLFGGLILVFDQPFQVGDKVSVGETYGEVVSIGLRSTRIVTPDDNLVSVPNAMVVDQQVANANAGELNCQVVTDLYLPGWADEDAAKRIAFDAAATSKYVYLNKPIVTLVSDVFKETFLTQVRVKAYVLDPRLEALFRSDVTERARAGFREAGLLRPEHMRPFLVEEAGFGTSSEIGPADHDEAVASRAERGDDDRI